MQREFKAVAGQLLKDVCLNTYQTFDYLVKLALDNNKYDLGYKCKTGDVFVFETDLVVNLGVLRDIEIRQQKFLTTEVPDPVDFGLNYTGSEFTETINEF